MKTVTKIGIIVVDAFTALQSKGTRNDHNLEKTLWSLILEQEACMLSFRYLEKVLKWRYF